MIEDDLRASFARHEPLTPDPGPLRAAIADTVRRRRRRRRLVRGAASALAVLLAVSTPALLRGPAGADRPGPATADYAGATDPLPIAPLNFLLLGVDAWSGRDHGHRADTVLIVHVPRERRQAYLISLPRDLGVQIPGYGLGKLNEAFHLGSHGSAGDERPDLAAGAELTVRTVTEMTGIRFDGTAVVTYAGLRAITDAVGGVRMCLPHEVRSVHTERVFPAACQRLGGAAALDLLRQRWQLPEGAHDRDRNGQRFAAALLARVTERDLLRDPLRMTALVRAAGDGLAVETGDRSLPELVSALRTVLAAEPVGIGWKYRSRTVEGRHYEELDPAVSAQLFQALRDDTVGGWVVRYPDHVTPR